MEMDVWTASGRLAGNGCGGVCQLKGSQHNYTKKTVVSLRVLGGTPKSGYPRKHYLETLTTSNLQRFQKELRTCKAT